MNLASKERLEHKVNYKHIFAHNLLLNNFIYFVMVGRIVRGSKGESGDIGFEGKYYILLKKRSSNVEYIECIFLYILFRFAWS